MAEIDAGQPEDAGYNPTISGMNLNFNRVFLAWGPGEAGPALAFSAPGAAVRGAGERHPGRAGGRRRCRGTASRAAREVWSLPRGGLRGSGSVWLPVRAPGALRRRGLPRGWPAQAGLALPAAEVVAAAPGAVLALRESDAAGARCCADMLRYSTNLTAEVVGLRAGAGARARRRTGSRPRRRR